MKKLKYPLFFFIILLNLQSVQVMADSFGENCGTPITAESFKELVSFVKNTYFPEFENVNIGIREFSSKSYFLQAKISPGSLLGSRLNRKYFIEINPFVYRCPPSHDGLEAILVHELEHIKDYVSMGPLQIISLAEKYLNSEWRAGYERNTDEKALKKGLGMGLIDYRLWLYSQLSPRELLKKKLYYYTPWEIELWLNNH